MADRGCLGCTSTVLLGYCRYCRWRGITVVYSNQLMDYGTFQVRLSLHSARPSHVCVPSGMQGRTNGESMVDGIYMGIAGMVGRIR